MRRMEDLPNRRPSRLSGKRRVVLAAVAGALFVGLLSLRGVAGFYTDYLWFDSLGRTDVWGRVLGAKVVLWFIFFAVLFALVWVNLLVADRLAPSVRVPGPEEEFLAGYRDIVGPRSRLVRVLVSVVFAFLGSIGVGAHWADWLLFTNSQSFGVNDPQFGTDIGFYVFELPFLTFVVSWVFGSLVMVFVLTVTQHYLNGGIRLLSRPGARSTSGVKVHLSAVLALLAVVKAADYWLDRYSLTISRRGVVDGALYTDVNAQLPALYLLTAISLSAVVLLLINLRKRGWALPIIAVGLWAFVAIVMGGIYPAFVQRFQVEPNETSREVDFTQRNIDATREGFLLEPDVNITETAFAYSTDLSAEELRENAETVRNARLLDPLVVHPTFERFEALRDFYRFEGLSEDGGPPALDTDRYLIDGQLTQVVLGSRELKLGDSTDLSWEREHVRLTHGYGVALATANLTTPEGSPKFLAGGLPVEVDPTLDLGLEQPQIYHGEGLSSYALVAADADELDYVDSATNQDVPTRYDGESGVAMGSFVRRMAFAMRFGQIEPLISSFVTDETRIIYNRDVRGRVESLAPFLEFDADAYPVVYEGRIHYVIDAYTTTDRFPYGQHADTSGIGAGDLAGKSFNYVRNSVKAVVDAYDGDVHFYRMPIEDPIADAWASAFPDLFTPFADMPEALREHLRYPQDLFRVQTNMWARYQVSNPQSLIIGTERWDVAQNPGREVIVASGRVNTIDENTGLLVSREERIDPYYTLLRLPGEDDLSFVTIRSFVPFDENDDRRELEAFIVAETRPDGTSRMVSYEITSPNAPGPVLVASAIAQDEAISSELSLLNRDGSTVAFGDLLMLPLGDSILWVRPLYVAAQGEASVPTLQRVIATVGEGEKIAIASSLGEALTELFNGEDFSDILGSETGADDEGSGPVTEPTEPIEPTEPTEPADEPAEPSDGQPSDVTNQDPAALLAQVATLFDARLAALSDSPPNEVRAAELLAEIAALLEQVTGLTSP